MDEIAPYEAIFIERFDQITFLLRDFIKFDQNWP